MVVGRKWVVKKVSEGVPTKDNFELVSEELGALGPKEVCIETEYLSVDPYQRMALSDPQAVGCTVIGSQVAKVVESNDPDYPVGCVVVSGAGWIEKANINPSKMNQVNPGSIIKAPPIGKLQSSVLVGACGMPGNTAYFGLTEFCKPKAGETVVVNAAAGAVGSLVGQIAKLKGCKVIGFAGADDKVEWLKKDLGFDYAFNYKKISTEEALKIAAPNGIDCFFENVGGPASSTIINNMNLFGRIAVCGAISTYNDTGVPTMVPSFLKEFIGKQIKMEGFIVQRFGARWGEGIAQMAEWIQGGKIKVRETVVQGFDNAPEAFMGFFSGTNTGKMVIKV